MLILSMLLAASAPADSPHQFCSAMSELAETVMAVRQFGVPMRDAAKIAKESSDIPEVEALVSFMVQSAYREPRYNSDRFRTQAKIDFGSEWYAACIEEFGDDQEI